MVLIILTCISLCLFIISAKFLFLFLFLFCYTTLFLSLYIFYTNKINLRTKIVRKLEGELNDE